MATKLFSYVGVEPTFTTKIGISAKIYKLGKDFLEILQDQLLDIIISKIEDKLENLPFIYKVYNDGGDLEIPSHHNYNTLEPLVKEYKQLVTEVAKFDYHPSSIIDREIEGGCHINFNLVDRYTKDSNKVQLFAHNLVCFLNNNPGIIWSYLAPEDNESSNILLRVHDKIGDKNYSKGDNLLFRCNNRYYSNRYGTDIECVELRFFMMPRSVNEFAFHIKSASAILTYVWNLTCKGIKLNLKYTDVSQLQKLTFDKVFSSVKSILPKIGISYKEFEKFGKHNILKERFSYPKEYLI